MILSRLLGTAPSFANDWGTAPSLTSDLGHPNLHPPGRSRDHQPILEGSS